MKIVVVGGNAAGPAAAAKAKRTNPDADVAMFEAGTYISTGTCELPYVLNNTIGNADDLVFFNADEFREEKGVETFTGNLVTDVNAQERNIKVFDKKSQASKIVNYDKLILATGSRAVSISGFTSNYKNVFNLKSVTDLKAVQSYINQNGVRSVLIVGAGYIGLEAADAFSDICDTVTIADKNSLPLVNAEPEISKLAIDLLEQNNVKFIGDFKDITIRGDEFINQVKFDNEKIKTDLVLVSAGVKPETSLALSAKINLGNTGAIAVDNKLKTTNQHIFAAGDCIEVSDFITGKKIYHPVATIAHQSGHIAGENAAGGNKIFKPVIRNTIFKLFDSYICQVGLNAFELAQTNKTFESVSAIAYNLVKVMPGSRKIFGKILYDKYNLQIYGAQFAGGSEISGYGDIISLMIKSRISVSELDEVNFNYSPPVSPFVNLLSVLGRKIRK